MNEDYLPNQQREYQTKQGLVSTSGGYTSSPGLNPPITIAPKEPSIINRAIELVGYVDQLEFDLSTMRSSLFGEAEANGTGGCDKASGIPLEQLVANACQRLSNCLGALRTINRKLGVEDPRSQGGVLNGSRINVNAGG